MSVKVPKNWSNSDQTRYIVYKMIKGIRQGKVSGAYMQKGEQ